jgi:transcriptional regulator with XRE-family HTH domain
LEKTFGDTVKKLRESRGLTLREVAEVLAIDTSMLGKIEKNTRTPTGIIIEKFSELFDVSIKELKVSYLSDIVVYNVVKDKQIAAEVLQAAKKKIVYLKEINSL